MGALSTILEPLAQFLANSSLSVVILGGSVLFLVLAIVLNVLNQLLFRNPAEPPVVFHWIPFIGNTVPYGIDPFKFFFSCREKYLQYGDVFTFILLGKKTTVCLGTKGNEFILNAKHKDVNAEEVYSALCTPVFGKDVVYDCPNAKLMEQKKFIKFGLTQDALRSYVHIICKEANDYIGSAKAFQGQRGTVNIPPAVSQLTIFTASHTLQGAEVRSRFNHSFAELFHDLDKGFSPINFVLPWAPLPHNRKRDAAHQKMVEIYSEIIQTRRQPGVTKDSEDMIWNLMDCKYKDGKAIPDYEIAGMMIALLMAGQHSSSSTFAWMCLRLADNPEVMDELLEEQKQVLGQDLPDITHEHLQKLPLHAAAVRETLRLHAPIHSIMRKATSPLPVAGTSYAIPAGRTLLASPGATSRMPEYFPNPMVWDAHRWEDGSPNHPSLGATDDDEKVDYGYGLVSKGTSSPYLPFGAGRHRCIGEQFAYVQLQALLAVFVRTFKFKNLPGKEGVVGTDFSSLFSKPFSPAIVEWEKRQNAKGE
ncbi:14-alpha sterol demethylase Cyp51B [Eremomyces bilateralis CBS 781.70]|uniref:14-alpha sterol demethylase Cyp51B n=1 Tax=Eremomyces bilateralis CBS 781.70 TaxID=1392243 RepID=A0A6G1GAT1_9PEZI|nr:14-alpha sterol demethylase Cyp51B [Eremomyces bilateralis CBS 781.70]KAF1815010.1 14-alpha sterol demethylase Cyp51B [Eremomyces bilateralis CBS 781.70]